MQNTFNRCYDSRSLDSEFKTDFCNNFGYTLDYRKKEDKEPNCFKTCCNHKKKVNKKVNNKK